MAQAGAYRAVAPRARDGEYEAVNHRGEEYVRGIIDTNNMETFWSLFKRGIAGTCRNVSKKKQHRSAESASEPPEQPQTKGRWLRYFRRNEAVIAQPTTPDEQHRAKEEDYWRRSLSKQRNLNLITFFAAAVGIAGIGILWGTLKDTQIQAQVALDALHSQRPLVLLGKPDGSAIVEYLRPANKKEKKGAMLINLYNAGPAYASHVLVNAFSSLGAPQKLNFQHLVRYIPLMNGKPIGIVGGGGSPVAPQAIYPWPLDDRWVPTPTEWKEIQTGTHKGSFNIQGTVEYCDNWGNWRCDAFMLVYRPLPLDKFLNLSMPPEIFCKNQPDPKELAAGPGLGAIVLPPCGAGTDQQDTNHPQKHWWQRMFER